MEEIQTDGIDEIWKTLPENAAMEKHICHTLYFFDNLILRRNIKATLKLSMIIIYMIHKAFMMHKKQNLTIALVLKRSSSIISVDI